MTDYEHDLFDYIYKSMSWTPEVVIYIQTPPEVCFERIIFSAILFLSLGMDPVDVTFCLSLYEMGYRNVYWPFAELIHYESVSVGSYSMAPPEDYEISFQSYKPYLNHNDPFFNNNLDLNNESIGLRSNYEQN